MVNYGIFISRERSRKGVVTPIVYLSGNSFRTFWNVSSSAQLDSSCNLVWISKSEISSIFPSSIGRSKKVHTNDYCMFLGPGQPYFNARAINRPNLSKSPLFNFLVSCNKVKDLLVPCIIFLAAASKCNVKNSLSGPPASNAGSPIKTVGIGLRLDFNWRFNLMLVYSHIFIYFCIFLTHRYHQHQFDLSHIHFQRRFSWLSRV